MHLEMFFETHLEVGTKSGIVTNGKQQGRPLERNGAARKVAFKLFLSCFFNRNSHRVESVWRKISPAGQKREEIGIVSQISGIGICHSNLWKVGPLFSLVLIHTWEPPLTPSTHLAWHLPLPSKAWCKWEAEEGSSALTLSQSFPTYQEDDYQDVCNHNNNQWLSVW